ncbi:MAG: iron-containing alcohol dehydrogenase [Desulfobacterales bacterium]|nr:iron-containing alcohol dehydrogenase [Desulfobacterales bacterium]
MLPEFFEFCNPTKIIYGVGIASDLKTQLDNIEGKRYFIVADKIIYKLGLVKKVTDGIKAAGYDIAGEFLDIPPDSEIKAVKACAEKAKETNADGFISIGGGSVIDTAKVANILYSNGGDLAKYYSGVNILTKPLKTSIVIPTTSGTGSEVTTVATIYDEKNKVKLAFTDKFLRPNLAVLDPEMTITMSPKITAITAMDALTHSIEAYVGINASPISDIFASSAVNLIFQNLIAAAEDGNNIEARGNMLIASTLAGIAFNHSMVGCVHSMAHAAGGLYNVPHGVANGIFLPHGLEYNFEYIKDKLICLAHYIGLDVATMSIAEGARKVIQEIRHLTKKLNELGTLDIRLRDVGVPEDGLLSIAKAAVKDVTSFFNPREIVAEEILINIKNAY